MSRGKRPEQGIKGDTMDVKIPQIQMDILSRTLLSAMERFYSIPDNLTRFEEWKQSEEGKAYMQRATA